MTGACIPIAMRMGTFRVNDAQPNRLCMSLTRCQVL